MNGTPSPQRELLLLLKTLGDKHRLEMLAMINHREYTVTEIAGLLNVTEPTVSHHISKMHSAGLLRLRMAGNQHFYHINEKKLAHFKALVAEIDHLPTTPEPEPNDDSWIDALDWDAADKKVLRDYIINGKMPQFPTKMKKYLVILRWLATKFEPNIRYTEKQVNAIISEVNEDYATLRRDLIELGFMRRQRGGGDYWLAPEDSGEGAIEGTGKPLAETTTEQEED